MPLARRLIMFSALMALASIARADVPQINNVSPAGVQRGVTTVVTIQGANLAANPKIITPIPLSVDMPDPAVLEAGKWSVKLTAPADLPVGVYPFRIVTDGGISNPFLLAVGQLPNSAETEPNNTFETAQSISIPCTVEGQLSGNDVDYFRFAGRKGQKVLIDAQCARIGSGVDPQIRLARVNRAFVAAVDDTPGLFTDARMVVDLPADDDYVIEISDTKYQGTGRAVYRLSVGSVPAADEIYPLGGRRGETLGLELRGGSLSNDIPSLGATALRGGPLVDASLPRITNLMLGLAGPTDPVYDVELPAPLQLSNYPELREAAPGAAPTHGAPPVVFNGRIGQPGEEDRFHVFAQPGQVLRIRVHAADLGSALDGSLRVINPANNQQIGAADDTAVPPTGLRDQPRKIPGTTSQDPTMEVTMPGGVNEIAILIKDVAGQGGIGYPYRIVVEPAQPAVYLQLANEANVSIPRGGTVVVPVSVVRMGFNASFTLNVKNPPPGLTVRPGVVADRAGIGFLSLSAAPDAAFGAVVLDIVGTSADNTIAGEPVGKLVVFAQQQGIPSASLWQDGLAAAPAVANVVALDAPAEPIEAVHGFPAAIPIKVTRNGDPAKGELTIPVVQPLPGGLTMGEVKIAAEAAEGTINVNVDPATAIGPVTLGFNARGKFENKDQTFGMPAVTLNVVRPVEPSVEAAKLEIKPGQTAELKGKVTRRGAFNQPVTLQLNGLPEGLSAEPVTLAPETADFTITIKAAENAAAAEAKCQLAVATFKVADKDYNTPNTPVDVKVVP